MRGRPQAVNYSNYQRMTELNFNENVHGVCCCEEVSNVDTLKEIGSEMSFADHDLVQLLLLICFFDNVLFNCVLRY
jgi:hypothetical protein